MNTASITPAPHRGRGGLRRAVWWLAIVSVLFCLTLAGLGVALWEGLSHWGGPGVSVTINGEDVTRALDLSGWPPAHKLVLVGVLATALLLALLVVPVALMFGSIALVFLVLGAVGLPVLLALLIVAAVFSPLWLGAWWLIARSRHPAQADTGRTIDA